MNKIVKGLFFWQGWHPEVALRYLPVVSLIRTLGPHPTILDVGSGGLGIAPYIGYKVTGVDIRFRPPFHRNLDRIKAKAQKLPFADGVFDAVVSVDSMEHLQSELRQKAVREMLRTARKLMVIAVPCGKDSYLQDKILSRIYRRIHHKKYHFFDEQLKLGLPQVGEIKDAINLASLSLNKKISLKVLDNESLGLRSFLMRGWISKNIFINIFFRKILLFALPLMTKFNSPPVYRKIFAVSIK